MRAKRPHPTRPSASRGSFLLVLQQAEEGKILLPGKVSDYLPWYRKDTGTPPDFGSPEFSATPAAARRYEHQEFAEKFGQPALASAPGTKWEYSNCGYNLLGLICDTVIIARRNVCGSTEGLGQNIRAILFDAVLHLPSRNPKDIAAQICLVPIPWIASHVALAVNFFLFIAITIWFLSRHKQPAWNRLPLAAL